MDKNELERKQSLEDKKYTQKKQDEKNRKTDEHEQKMRIAWRTISRAKNHFH